jgi:regulator of nucleoside diphosphate kinase
MTDTQIVLSRGIYDLLKTQIRKRKLTKYNEEKLDQELKYALQVNSKEIPENIVAVDTRVVVTELETGEKFTYNFVAPEKAKAKNNTISIMSPIGVALLGYGEGAEVEWEMSDGIKKYRIEEVSNLKK